MKRIIALFVALLVLVGVVPCMAANTVVTQGAFVQITPDGSADWDTGNEGRITSITFVPSATSDKLVVHAYSLTGPIVYQVVVPSTAPVQRIFLTHQTWKPYIKASECTFNTAGNVRIIFEYE